MTCYPYPNHFLCLGIKPIYSRTKTCIFIHIRLHLIYKRAFGTCLEFNNMANKGRLLQQLRDISTKQGSMVK